MQVARRLLPRRDGGGDSGDNIVVIESKEGLRIPITI